VYFHRNALSGGLDFEKIVEGQVRPAAPSVPSLALEEPARAVQHGPRAGFRL
jgi:hypothetical protein